MTTYISALLQVIVGRISKSERGATAVEYGIMVALIAVAVIVTVTALGLSLSGLFGTVDNSIP